MNEKVLKPVIYTAQTKAPILGGYPVNFGIAGSPFPAKYVQLYTGNQETKSGISG